MKIILLVLLLALPAYSQVTVKYDKFKDVTVAFSDNEHLVTKYPKGGNIRFRFNAYYTHFGQVKQDEHYFLVFANGCRLNCLGRGLGLIFLVDGERLDLGAGKYALDNLPAPLGLNEKWVFPISRNELETITGAKDVTFQLGVAEGKLSDDLKTGIKELLSK